MDPLELVQLSRLMARTRGSALMRIGLIDGPVATSHPDFAGAQTIQLGGKSSEPCTLLDSAACRHGTCIAGILVARRGSMAPAICPGCTLIVRPIFSEGEPVSGMPTATPAALAAAINDCVDAGARVINVSAAMTWPSPHDELKMRDALDRAAQKGVIVVAAAGNQGTLGSSVVTRHPCVIPVIACDLEKRPLSYSNLGRSIGRSGLAAPGEGVTSVGSNGEPARLAGTSIATPFVTGTIGLLWSEFPGATAAGVKDAVLRGGVARTSVVPPVLDAWAAYEAMQQILGGRS